MACRGMSRRQTPRVARLDEPPKASRHQVEDTEDLSLCRDEDEDLSRLPESSDHNEQSFWNIKPIELTGQGRSQAPAGSSRHDDDFGAIREQHRPTTSSKAQIGSLSPLHVRRKGNEVASSTLKKVKLETYTASRSNPGDIFGILRSSDTGKRANPKTYSSRCKIRAMKGSQSNSGSSQETSSKPSVQTGSQSPSTPKNGFKTYDLDTSPESEPTEPKFINPLNKRDLSQTSSPTGGAQFKPIRDFNCILEPEDDELAFHMPTFDESLDDDELPELRPFRGRIPLQPLENIEYAESQDATFRIPPPIDDLLHCGPAELNSGGEASFENGGFSLEDSLFEKSPLSPEVTRQATCPMCGAAVNAEFLKTYNSGKQMNTRTQAKFCGAHKKRSAQDEWVSRGYPTIDWDGLEARMAKHHSYLKDLLDGASSYSRDMLDEHVKSGKNRTLKQAVMDSDLLLTPGYYGSRGMMAMSENIMYKFSSQLRRIAVKDRLVSARGVTSYVQAVLVPELAVRLIGEDMGVGVEEARQVMRESVSLGDLLNEEVEDVVVWKEGDVCDN